MAHSDFDSAWKDALDAYFPQCMALLWPDMHARIDWRRVPVFLDKELQALLRSRRRGRRHVDKLVSVRLLGGQDALVLIHVEVQSGRDSGFARRMFDYHVRLREKHPHEPVVSVAVLTEHRFERGVANGASRLGAGGSVAADGGDGQDDECGQVRDTAVYAYDYWGCELRFIFPVVCLEDWRARWEELLALAPHNPFAVVILAQLEANATRDAAQRLVRKTELVRRLYHWGFSRDNVIQLFRVIEAMLVLPEDLEFIFVDMVRQIEEDTQMPYVTSVERVLLKREREQGQHEKAVEVLAAQITRKFGHLPDWAQARMVQADEATLKHWALQILDAQRIEDVFV